MLRSQRHVDEALANVIKTMENADIKASNIFFYIVEQAGGAKKVGFLKADCDNFLQDERKVILEAGDAQNMINHLKKM